MSHTPPLVMVMLIVVSCTTAMAAAAPSVAERYQEGVALYDTGKFEQALRVWEGLLETHRDDLTRQQRVALMTRISAANRQLLTSPEANCPHAQARRLFDTATESFDKGVAQLRSKEERELASTSFGTVVDLLSEVEATGHDFPRFEYVMAFSCLHCNRLPQGWPYLDKLIAASPADPLPLNLKADYLRKRGGKTMDRIDVLQRSLKLDPTQREVHKALCIDYLSLRQRRYLHQAYAHALKAIGSDPQTARQLADAFPDVSYRNRLDALAAQIAVDVATERKASAAAKPLDTHDDGRISSFMIRVP